MKKRGCNSLIGFRPAAAWLVYAVYRATSADPLNNPYPKFKRLSKKKYNLVDSLLHLLF